MERYELHSDKFTKTKPYSLHYDRVKKGPDGNWHDSVELLLMKKGASYAYLNAEKLETHEDDIIFINSNTIHLINAADDVCEYYCLIVNLDFLEEFGLYFEDTIISSLITSYEAREIFEKIIEEETQTNDNFSSPAIISLIISLFVYLLRNHSVSSGETHASAGNTKTLMMRKALNYMKANYKEKIQISDIADYVNFSKDYLSHTFKEFTGVTIVYYLNFLRCRHAKNLLSRGNISVSNAAMASGFDNISHFSRTYKKIMGYLPSLKENSPKNQSKTNVEKDNVK